jgi:hypothetical protein
MERFTVDHSFIKNPRRTFCLAGLYTEKRSDKAATNL